MQLSYLTQEEYERLGFRCGLEIHQQLDTRQKLFCHCPVGLTNAEPDMRIERHMRPTLSELGEYDRTALMEFKTRKQVIYELFTDRTCTYEMDDTPPFPLNREALDIAIEIALLLNCKLVDEVHVTRKQYLDGSIPTGFQRTAMVGVDGWIPFRGRKIGIAALTLEEDSCREVSDIGHTITWKTDRLSTPLVEVITKADILSPLEVEEVNRLLGDLLRATGKVRRGIGTVRQDVNVSITGGTRVEIKGVPRLSWHQGLTHVEAMRQKAFLELAGELKRRGLTKENIFGGQADVTDLLRTCNSALLRRRALERGGRIVAQVYRSCRGVFNVGVQPERTFAEEVSGRIKVIACIDELPNLIHSDEPGISGLLNAEWGRIKERLAAGEEDLVVILFGEIRDVETAAGEVRDRMFEALEGVPHETRQPYADGHSGFERILPGPDRMYPDTDTPPTRITHDMVEAIKAKLPPRPWEREERYRAAGLAPEVAFRLSRAVAVNPVFDAVTAQTSVPARLAAHLLLRFAVDLRTLGPFKKIPLERWVAAFDLLGEGRISRQSLQVLVHALVQYPDKSAAELVKRFELAKVDGSAVDAVMTEVAKGFRRHRRSGEHAAAAWLTGIALKRLAGRCDGAVAAERAQLHADEL